MSEVVGLSINGSLWNEWSHVALTKHLDGISQLELTSIWDPSRADMRAAFSPYLYQSVDCLVAGEQHFAGHIVTPAPSQDPKQASIEIAAYSRSGPLQDCKVPPEFFPLEFNKQKLDAIAAKIAQAMGVDVYVDADVGAPFERAALKPTDSPWTFLTDLAKQRGVLLGDDAGGDLVIRAVDPAKAAVATFEHGLPPMSEISWSGNGQNYFSEHTALASSKLGAKGGKNTVSNPWLDTPRRADVFTADKSEKGDLPRAAQAKFARTLAAAGSWSIKVPTWRDGDGKLWTPGDFVHVKAPHVFIYEQSKLLIRTAKLVQSKADEFGVLNVVLKESFTDLLPETRPWG